MSTSHIDSATVNLFPFHGAGTPPSISPLDPANSEVKNVAVCFSGGGSRALAAAMGQMRGLRHLGLLDKTQYISGVSGGAWATTIYSYVPETISDDDLLGAVCNDPSMLTLDKHDGDSRASELDYLPPDNMGKVPSRLSLVKAAEQAWRWHKEGIANDEIWVRLVGNDIFRDYQRYSGYGQSKYFTWNESWFDHVIAPNNPHLTINDFYTFPGDRYRPALFIYGSLMPRESTDAYELLPFVFSPYWSGVLAEFPKRNGQATDIGGGAIDPFGLASRPEQAAGAGLRQVRLAANRFSLADMAGISSAFFAEILATKMPELDSLLPEYLYWSVMDADSPSHRYPFADGGNLEDTGIASTLRFGPRNLVAFVNSSTPLGWDESQSCAIIDSQVPPLFGYQPYKKGATWPGQDWGYRLYPDAGSGEALLDPAYATYRDNQVFPSEAFKDLLDQMWQARQRGGAVLCYQPQLTLVPNGKYGVGAGTVNMLWAYNNPVAEWHGRLHWTVKAYIDLDPFVRDFPCYATADVQLSARQVNLLAHLSCWNITSDSTLSNCEGLSNHKMFERMYR